MDIEKALERLREIEMPEEMKKRILSKMSVDQEKSTLMKRVKVTKVNCSVYS